MACASFEIPAGDMQEEILRRFKAGAAFMDCETDVFPERWDNRRAVTLHAWTSAIGDTVEDDLHLELCIEKAVALEAHGEFLQALWPGRYGS